MNVLGDHSSKELMITVDAVVVMFVRGGNRMGFIRTQPSPAAISGVDIAVVCHLIRQS